MWKDEIIEELYAQRAAHAAKLGYSAQKFFEEIQEHEAISRTQGWQFVDACAPPLSHALGNNKASGALAQ